MKWFNNLKVGVKLVGAFIVVAAFAGIVGFVAIRNMSLIDQGAERIYKTELMGISLFKASSHRSEQIGTGPEEYAAGPYRSRS